MLVGFLLIHHGYAAPVCVHRICQVRRLGIPAMAPRMDTTRVSASIPNVTHELTVAPSCTAAAAFSACCRARSAYCARKVRASAAPCSGLPPPAATRSRNWTSAVRASSVDMPVAAANTETVCGSSSRSMTRDGSVNPSRCARSPPPATAPRATAPAVRVSPPSAPKRPERPRLIPWPSSQSRNTEPSVQTRAPWMSAPARSGRSVTVVDTRPPRKEAIRRVRAAQMPAPIPSPVTVLCVAARGSPTAVMPIASPNAVSNNIVPKAMINPLVTPPQRTRGPTGGTAAVGVSKASTERAVGSRRSRGGPSSRSSRLTSLLGSLLLAILLLLLLQTAYVLPRAHRPWPAGRVSARAHNLSVLVPLPQGRGWPRPALPCPDTL